MRPKEIWIITIVKSGIINLFVSSYFTSLVKNTFLKKSPEKLLIPEILHIFAGDMPFYGHGITTIRQ